jgi:peroxiredoxin
MLKLGTIAPHFELPDANGEMHSLRNAEGADAVVVMFICNHCPFVKHLRQELAQLGRDCTEKNVAVFAINSNDAQSHPGDSPANMRKEIEAWGYTFPYLVDENQQVAKSYEAACTPDFFVFDRDLRLVYRGQLDASRPSNDVPVTGSDLRAAIEAARRGQAPEGRQLPSIGCNIKWKPGNEPDRL